MEFFEYYSLSSLVFEEYSVTEKQYGYLCNWDLDTYFFLIIYILGFPNFLTIWYILYQIHFAHMHVYN